MLQEREFERLGGTEPVKANVRLIAATNQDLEKAIAAGTFREDLHYRLNVFTIYVPPLRERKPDILLLVDHFLEKYSIEHGHQVKRISTPAIDMLMSYHWPGNVRELENAIERAVLVCDGSVVHPHHLPPTLQTAEASGTVHDVVARRRGGRLREDPHPGRPQDRARQRAPRPPSCCIPPSASSATRSASSASTATGFAADPAVRRRLHNPVAPDTQSEHICSTSLPGTSRHDGIADDTGSAYVDPGARTPARTAGARLQRSCGGGALAYDRNV